MNLQKSRLTDGYGSYLILFHGSAEAFEAYIA